MDDLNAWIEREFGGYGVALRREDEPPISGEPLMSMAVAKRITRKAVMAFASRPQEQPRKATGDGPEIGKAIGEARGQATVLRAHANGPPDEHTATLLDTAAQLDELADRLSVSPAAAEGWQPRETAPKNGTLEWRVLMHWRDMGSSSGWELTAMTHWRPQEQENGEQT